MGNITYLLGAGASFGKRDENKPILERQTSIRNNNLTKTSYKYANITEGLPLVTEIPGRLAFVIDKIKYNPYPPQTRKLIFSSESLGNINFDKAKDMLISDLEWLKNASENHATIDTFAKKLYLKGQLNEFYKVETLLSIFFIIEQTINKIDGRYDTFLASILNNQLNIDDRITILTWNYDSQFEIAYKEYGTQKEASSIRSKLGIADLKDQSYETRNQIFKLNGSANFMSQIDLSSYNHFDDTLLIKLLDIYKWIK